MLPQPDPEAPTGRHKTAQGSALGVVRESVISPEGATEVFFPSHMSLLHSVSPLQGLSLLLLGPRASPWAILLCPFGANGVTAQNLFRETQ